MFCLPVLSFSLLFFQHSLALSRSLSLSLKKKPEKNNLSVSKSRRMNDAAAEHKTMPEEGKKYKKNLYRSIGSLGSP